jgi:hypothetical protein
MDLLQWSIENCPGCGYRQAVVNTTDAINKHPLIWEYLY